MLMFNLYLREVGYAETFIGRLWSMHSLGAIVMTFPAVWLLGRFSVRWVVAVSAALAATCYCLLATAALQVILVLSAIGMGMMITTPRVAGAPFFMRHTSQVERSHVFSLQFGAMLGAGLFAYFGGGWVHQLLETYFASPVVAFRAILLAGAGSALMGALFFSTIPGGQIAIRNKNRTSLTDFVRKKGAILFKLTFPFFIIGIGAGLVIPFLNLYFRDRFGMEPLSIGFYYGLVQSSMLVGVLVGPYLARRWGMIHVVVATQLASLPFMVVLAFSQFLPLAVVAFVMRGALMNMGIPIANNYMMEKVGESDRALTNALSMLAWTSSWAVATWTGGALIEQIGYTTPLLIAAALYAISSVLYLWFFRREDIKAGDGAASPTGRIAGS